MLQIQPSMHRFVSPKKHPECKCSHLITQLLIYIQHMHRLVVNETKTQSADRRGFSRLYNCASKYSLVCPTYDLTVKPMKIATMLIYITKYLKDDSKVM